MNPLEVLTRTEEPLAFAVAEEHGRPVLLELVKVGAFYKTRGWKPGAFKPCELLCYRRGSYGAEFIAEEWLALTGDATTAHELRRGRL